MAAPVLANVIQRACRSFVLTPGPSPELDPIRNVACSGYCIPTGSVAKSPCKFHGVHGQAFAASAWHPSIAYGPGYGSSIKCQWRLDMSHGLINAQDHTMQK